MPIVDSPYTDPDSIQGLYDNPDDEVLLAEYALNTGAAAAAAQALLYGANNPSTNATTGGVFDAGDGSDGSGGGRRQGDGRGPVEPLDIQQQV